MKPKYRINIQCPKCSSGLKNIEFNEDIPEHLKCDICCHDFVPTIFNCRVVPL